MKIESRISTAGCVVPLRVLRGSQRGDINRSALLALAQWRFAPGTINGRPVPVLFRLGISFSVR